MTDKACDPKCFYCENVLSPRHEHDHFPIPRRHGGELVFCTCINCHDLKDRIPLKDWPLEALVDIMNIWPKLGTMQRLWIGKLTTIALDYVRPDVKPPT